MKSKKIKNGDIFVKIALAMLLLITVTFGINKDLYAKFITKDSGEDSAQVAKFEINMSDLEGKEPFFQGIKMDFKQDQNGENTLENKESRMLMIKNNSEVACEVDFTINTTGNLPLTFLLQESSSSTMSSSTVMLNSTVGGDTTVGSGGLESGLYSVTSNKVSLDIGETLYFELTVSLIVLDAKYSGFVDLINIKILTTQVD